MYKSRKPEHGLNSDPEVATEAFPHLPADPAAAKSALVDSRAKGSLREVEEDLKELEAFLDNFDVDEKGFPISPQRHEDAADIFDHTLDALSVEREQEAGRSAEPAIPPSAQKQPAGATEPPVLPVVGKSAGTGAAAAEKMRDEDPGSVPLPAKTPVPGAAAAMSAATASVQPADEVQQSVVVDADQADAPAAAPAQRGDASGGLTARKAPVASAADSSATDSDARLAGAGSGQPPVRNRLAAVAAALSALALLVAGGSGWLVWELLQTQPHIAPAEWALTHAGEEVDSGVDQLVEAQAALSEAQRRLEQRVAELAIILEGPFGHLHETNERRLGAITREAELLAERVAAMESRFSSDQPATGTAAVPEPVTAAAAAVDSGEWVVNLATFASESAARSEARGLEARGMKTDIERVSTEGRVWYRVRAIGFTDVQQARAFAANDARRSGYPDAWISRR